MLTAFGGRRSMSMRALRIPCSRQDSSVHHELWESLRKAPVPLQHRCAHVDLQSTCRLSLRWPRLEGSRHRLFTGDSARHWGPNSFSGNPQEPPRSRDASPQSAYCATHSPSSADTDTIKATRGYRTGGRRSGHVLAQDTPTGEGIQCSVNTMRVAKDCGIHPHTKTRDACDAKQEEIHQKEQFVHIVFKERDR